YFAERIRVAQQVRQLRKRARRIGGRAPAAHDRAGAIVGVGVDGASGITFFPGIGKGVAVRIRTDGSQRERRAIGDRVIDSRFDSRNRIVRRYLIGDGVSGAELGVIGDLLVVDRV